MPDGKEGMPGGSEVSGGFFAALLAANKSNCDCDTCKILRKISNEMTKNYMPKE